ncbi:hypothetical protein R69927_05977 [Paraburkholderia domus]|nr:hypothetical protein R69927_05977 [Paraburkholderia domus]
MLRRTFIWSTSGSLLVLGAALSGCTTTSSSDASRSQQMDKRRSIDAGVDSTLTRLYGMASGSRELVGKAHGVLTFPSVIDAGFVVGGQYGEGSLRGLCQVGGRRLPVYPKRSYPYQTTFSNAPVTVQLCHVVKRSFSVARWHAAFI